MPRNTDSILYSLDTNPSSELSYGGFSRGGIWNIYPNTIGVPAGRNRGRFSTKQSLDNVQERYWNKGLPMGMELELELPEGDNYYRQNDSVTEVMSLINKRLEEGMKHFAMRKGRDEYRYVTPVSAKGDGSLRNGVEFNFQPMTTTAFRKYVATAFQDVGYSKFIGYNAPRAGIHIHIPKAAFSDVELYMYCILWHTLIKSNSNGKSFSEMIGQRAFNQYNGERLPFVHGMNTAPVGDKYYRVATDRASAAGKFNAFNYAGHGNTVEIRAFQSTQSPNRLIKNMAFVDNSWRYVHLLMDMVNDGNYYGALQFLMNADMFAGYLTNPNMKGFNQHLAKFVRVHWRRGTENRRRIFNSEQMRNIVSNMERIHTEFTSLEWEQHNTTEENTEEADNA